MWHIKSKQSSKVNTRSYVTRRSGNFRERMSIMLFVSSVSGAKAKYSPSAIKSSKTWGKLGEIPSPTWTTVSFSIFLQQSNQQNHNPITVTSLQGRTVVLLILRASGVNCGVNACPHGNQQQHYNSRKQNLQQQQQQQKREKLLEQNSHCFDHHRPNIEKFKIQFRKQREAERSVNMHEECWERETSAAVTKGWRVLRSQFLRSIAFSCLLHVPISFDDHQRFTLFQLIRRNPREIPIDKKGENLRSHQEEESTLFFFWGKKTMKRERRLGPGGSPHWHLCFLFFFFLLAIYS